MRDKICYKYGEEGSGLGSKDSIQDFKQLQQKCLERKCLFEDDQFPAKNSSIYMYEDPKFEYEWKRPSEILKNPCFLVDGYSSFDLVLGNAGNSLLVAAVANLTLNKNLFQWVVPDDQSFEENYAGIFHFRFWYYGQWVDVVIDDRLPTGDGNFLYLHSTKNEFWSSLLEKAWAKLCGSYEALHAGSTSERMEDLTGGICESIDIDDAPNNLFQIMQKNFQRSSLMGYSIESTNSQEESTKEGLYNGHAYSITKVCQLSYPQKISLIRLRNLLENNKEWSGPWSDKSEEWNSIPDSEKKNLGLIFDKDGEFWMSFDDFSEHFSILEICNLDPVVFDQELNPIVEGKKWETYQFKGSWVKNSTAGGSLKYSNTYHLNPQYVFTLEDDDLDTEDNKCTLIVALMQKSRRIHIERRVNLLKIGFDIFKLEDPEKLTKPLDSEFFKSHAPAVPTTGFFYSREVSKRFTFTKGTYCVIPNSYYHNRAGNFIIRIFSEKKINMKELDQELGMGEIDRRVKEKTERDESKKEYEKVKENFRKIAGDDLEIDYQELQIILNFDMREETNGKGFSIDICRSMIAMMDVDDSGKLGFDEFKALWVDIRNWKEVFKLYDKDNSGCLNFYELREALNSAGYRLNNKILNKLVHRYTKSDGEMSFDDFMLCAIRLMGMIETFKEKDPNNTNAVKFTLEEWVEKTMYS